MGKNVVNSGLTPLEIGTPAVTWYHLAVSKGTVHNPLLDGGDDVDISAVDAQALVDAAKADRTLVQGGLVFKAALAGIDGGTAWWNALDTEEEGALVKSVSLTKIEMMGPPA
jgi:hypothetical protein